MLIIGVTGSIGMGKTTVAKRLAEHGIPVFDADAEVHRLYEGEAVEAIARAFPGTVEGGRVDRARLAEKVLAEDDALARLEAIVHPMVRTAEHAFLARHAAAGAPMAALEIPLLFETGADQWVDVTIVVSASPATQRARVLERAGMSPEKLEAIRAQQIPDQEKRKRADYVVDTDRAIESTAAEIDSIVESLEGRGGRAIDRWLADGAEGRAD